MTLQHSSRARGKVDMPEDESGAYWIKRLEIAMAIINVNPAMLEVWDSDLVPDHATYKAHALLAEKIVKGEQLQTKLNVANQFEALNGLPTIQAKGRQMQVEVKRTVSELIDTEPQDVGTAVSAVYGNLDLIEFGSLGWFSQIKEEPY